MVPWNSTLWGFAYIWQSKWAGIIAIKTEKTQIHLLSGVLVDVASLDKDPIWYRFRISQCRKNICQRFWWASFLRSLWLVYLNLSVQLQLCIFFVQEYHNLLICFDASQCRLDKEDDEKSVGKFTKHTLPLNEFSQSPFFRKKAFKFELLFHCLL